MTKTKAPGIRRLFWDVEVSANIVLAWRAGYDLTINHDSIIQERKIICICWKFEGENKVYSLRWDKNQDDKAMLREFLKVANEADELCGHYADRFDLPWFKTRCLIHGFEPLPAYKTIDTKAWASKYFYFNSNKLDYVGSVLGLGKKIKTDYDLWKDIMLKRCPIALDKMVKYCCRDVDLLEKVYHKLKFCVKPKTHAGVMAGGDKWQCPRDGSTNVHLSKTKISAAGTRSYQFKCNDCGGYFTISDSAFRQYQEFKKKHK